jgi:uncharacterized protein (TIGR02270 family)
MMPKAVSQRVATNTAGSAGGSNAHAEQHPSALFVKRVLAMSEEAAFLWSSRSAVACSTAVTLDVLGRFDERLSRVVYTLGEHPVVSNLLFAQEQGAYKAGQSFVTAVVAVRSGVRSVFDALLDGLEVDPDLLLPLSSALSWLNYREVRPYLERLLASASPALVRLGIRAAVAHCAHPGAALDSALDSDDPQLRATASEAVGRLGARDRVPKIAELLGEQDQPTRFWSAWSCTRLGDRRGIPVLGRFINEGGPFALSACDIALRALDCDHAIHAHGRLVTADSQRLAVVAAGIIGDPRLANWLFDTMTSSPLARRAGAAFSLMTGRDLRRSDLDAEPLLVAAEAPAKGANGGDHAVIAASLTAPGLTEDEDDDDLVWPDVARIRRWWDGSQSAFIPGVRYVAGEPIRPATMAQVIQSGNQPQRAAAALELSLANPDAPLLDVTAPAHRQRTTDGGV